MSGSKQNTLFNNLLTLLAIVCAIPACGQADTLIQIQFPSVKTTVIPPKAVKAGNTSTTVAQPGSAGINALPSQVSQVNLMEGTDFTVPIVANNTLDVTAYPASTSIQLMTYKDGKAAGQCSGTMIAPDIALTAAHCLIDAPTRIINGDEIIVAAAGKNVINGGALVTRITRAYVLQDYFTNKSKEDIMLIKLADPIGDHTGWMGMSLTDDTVFLNNTLFHKFSFPARTYTPDSTPGRKLHYNYGLIDVLGPDNLGVIGRSAIATPGQSGSSLFYIDADLPSTVGVAIYARHYTHQRITQTIFNSFRSLVDESIRMANATPYIMYPNPMRQSSVVKTATRMNRYTMVITSAAGEIMKTQQGTDTDLIFIDRGAMSAGEYSFTLVDENRKSTRGNFRIID